MNLSAILRISIILLTPLFVTQVQAKTDGNQHWGECKIKETKVKVSLNLGKDSLTQKVLRSACSCVGGNLSGLKQTKSNRPQERLSCDNKHVKKQIVSITSRLADKAACTVQTETQTNSVAK